MIMFFFFFLAQTGRKHALPKGMDHSENPGGGHLGWPSSLPFTVVKTIPETTNPVGLRRVSPKTKKKGESFETRNGELAWHGPDVFAPAFRRQRSANQERFAKLAQNPFSNAPIHVMIVGDGAAAALAVGGRRFLKNKISSTETFFGEKSGLRGWKASSSFNWGGARPLQPEWGNQPKPFREHIFRGRCSATCPAETKPSWRPRRQT